jgi:integrase
MKANEATQGGREPTIPVPVSSGAKFKKVFAAGKRRLRGLWERNGRYYAQLTVDDPATGGRKVRRVPLEDKDGVGVGTVAEALKAQAALTTARDAQSLELTPRRTPTFKEASTSYFDWLDGAGAKSRKTITCERSFAEQLNQYFGDVRIRAVTEGTFLNYQARRVKKVGPRGKKVGPRCVNLELLVARNILKHALAEKLITKVPKVKPLKVTPKKPTLLTADEIERICTLAVKGWPVKGGGKIKPQCGQQFSDAVKLMAFSGGRLSETMSLEWSDVDFPAKQLHFRATETKNSQHRVLDFNADLEAHLRDMHQRRQPDSRFLFPSPKRGDDDAGALAFTGTLRMVRIAAGMPGFHFHLLRHYFISTCVMNGLDYMTVAYWVGHQDGGILIGKVYGHLNDEHKKAMAQRISFAPRVVTDEAVAP